MVDSVGYKIQFSAVEEDEGTVVVEGAESASGGFDRLDAAIEAIALGVGDPLPKVTQQFAKAPLEHLGLSGDWWPLITCGPVVPVLEERRRT